jgi:hypothetical protein
LLNEAIYRADVIRSVGIAAHMFLPYSGRKWVFSIQIQSP